MSREEKIKILIMDRIWEWIYARCDEGLWELLRVGFVGFDSYSDKELNEAVKELDDQVDVIKEMLRREKERKEESSGIALSSDPFE